VWLVLGILLVAAGLALFAVWFQWGQTRRCLTFFGATVAHRIQSARRVELWTLAAEGDAIRVVSRQDVSHAPGLVHLRRGLIEDLNYEWRGADGVASTEERRRLHFDVWDVALAFWDAPASDPRPTGSTSEPVRSETTVLAFDLDAGGGITIVGQPGRVSLGRIASGLRTWVDETRKTVTGTGKPGF
jgi:hypothetical protein